MVLSVLSCKRGIAPRIAVDEQCLPGNARAMPTWHERQADHVSGRQAYVCVQVMRDSAGTRRNGPA
jgi:hypothetical protein